MQLTMGVDIGSASSKAVILRDGRDLVAQAAVQSGTGTSGPDRVMEEIMCVSNKKQEDIAYTVVTGYGRFSLDAADKQISEISCHAKGVHFFLPDVRTILDIGGQDVKAISIDENGAVQNFYMNDKCAAGTGRFIEVMSRILEIDITEMGNYDKLSQNPVTVSSTCTVFAESEVISLLSQKKAKEDIIRGVHESVVNRAAGLLYRTRMEEDFALTGGVAQNSGVARALERELKRKIYIADHPQMTGAVGAALFAWEALHGEKRI
ncbi:2-hydroxyglutaryl-CoA dehydratase [Caproiciproducens sp. NJN-50]|uniref:acyl-CoA dehydratase activase n=1 Tax=Acutalibacteraceae TaxID=3082771 RepID=UPI000FFE1557|nr:MULTISPECIES: acyl-CoA dehydratase activase [Acutalibacteraceae]QAT49967.1 2-hydroxyglutaryl-CoA dehydratase [Caproiciproducens sp. NJN-50]